MALEGMTLERLRSNLTKRHVCFTNWRDGTVAQQPDEDRFAIVCCAIVCFAIVWKHGVGGMASKAWPLGGGL
jgi:hypothetical protein